MDEVKTNNTKDENQGLSPKNIKNTDAEILDRLTKKLNIRLDAIKRSETITTEMLNRRFTI
jgi:hypothetical protein